MIPIPESYKNLGREFSSDSDVEQAWVDVESTRVRGKLGLQNLVEKPNKE